MQRICANAWCRQAFEITDSDLAILDKVSPVIAGKQIPIPPPTLCPDCRQQRRLTFRNERHLHTRKCNGTGKIIVSTYSQNVPFPVFSQEYWWGDTWDPLEFGLPWNPSQSFMEQLAELSRRVPRFALTVSTSENCEFNNFCAGSKNCYMSQRIGDSEDAYYSYMPFSCRSVCDCYNIEQCERCYELTDAKQCFNCTHSQNVVSCSDSHFLFNCRDCKNCCLCTNLRGKEFCFQNQQLSAEEYERAINNLTTEKQFSVLRLLEMFTSAKKAQIVPALWATNTENVTGNYLTECRNTIGSFDCKHSEDAHFAYGHVYGHDVMDCSFGFHIDQAYDFAAGVRSQGLCFCFCTLEGSHDLAYCIDCVNGSHDLFGCIGMKHAQYCILNRQYTKEEYEKIVPRIIEKMRENCTWGEYFPPTLSPFSYDETVAQEYFPLTKDDVLRRGWNWRDQTEETPHVDRIIEATQLPDSIDDIPEDILSWAITCSATGKPFRIIRRELDFYRSMRIPIPRLHPNERHHRRMALRNPRKLWNRECAKCGKEVETSYGPERPERVYCESCYLKEVY